MPDDHHTLSASQSGAPADAHTLALQAVGWMLNDEKRADRLLALTGLTPDTLREGLAQPHVLSAVLDHLANYEPDLLGAADAIGCDPAALVNAAQELRQ